MPAAAIVYVPWLILGASGGGEAPAGWRLLGLVPILGGLAVLLLCFVGFVVEGQGTPAPYDPPRRLVTGALYARVRNPIYLAVLTTLLGEAIVFGSGVLLVWVVAAALMFHSFVVGYEEPGLRARFGAPYEDYLKRVPRWIPRARCQAATASSR